MSQWLRINNTDTQQNEHDVVCLSWAKKGGWEGWDTALISANLCADDSYRHVHEFRKAIGPTVFNVCLQAQYIYSFKWLLYRQSQLGLKDNF